MATEPSFKVPLANFAYAEGSNGSFVPMSSAVNIASAAAASSQAQTQAALATRFVKMNAESAQSVVQLIESASANMQQMVQSAQASGIGANLDISA